LIELLGLDLSLTSTGVSHGDQQYVLTPQQKGVERLAYFFDTISSLLQKMNQPAIVMEGYSFASRNSQAHSIGELGGVVKLAAWKLEIPIVIVPPTSRAKFATGKGNASKSEVVSAISAKTGIVWDGKGADDKCDAWILEEIGRVHVGTQRHDWPKQNIEALSKVDFSALDETLSRRQQ
jgi:Holliday junction resolvasome RuvABC endonuclease subunit